MKRILWTLLCCLTVMFVSAQNTTQNYLHTRKMLNSTGSSYVDHISYHDGLGRPFQQVEQYWPSSGGVSTLTSQQGYDLLGRPSVSYLPLPGSSNFVSPNSVATSLATHYGDSHAYSTTAYDGTSRERVTSVQGAGDDWLGKVVSTEYLTNNGDDRVCLLYRVDTQANVSQNETYAAGTLRVVKTTDEDGKVSYVFTDNQDRILLERRMNGSEMLDTYYVYDDYGNLGCVLPPAIGGITSSSGDGTIPADSLNRYAYLYRYNDRNLCFWKKLPGVEPVKYVYDDHDRLVFSQNGNQRASGKWTFYVYDHMNRLAQQGENTLKEVDASKVYLQNYYTNYGFVGKTGFTDERFENDTTGYSTGSLTGTVMNVLGGDAKIYTAYYYDFKGRVTKKVQSNLLGGYDVTTTTYTFTGNPETVTYEHTATGKTARTEVYTYTYDHADRLSTVKHKLGSTEVTLASYTYDALGRQATKKLHGSSTNTMTYSYNIRSWLTGISSGKFAQTLGYGGHYNGNISTMNCITYAGDTISHAYTFTYDGLNQIKDAVHGTGDYTEKVTEYDKNGNIKKLQRYGNGLIDDLTYTYNGNQLTKVKDESGNASGFTDGASAANEYTYDHNGNLTKDSNKGITNIAYNCLNLPSTVTFSDGSTIVYSYAADGTKLRTVHTISGTTTQKDYCANVVYENGVQKLLLTEEGYVDLSASTLPYYYYLKDHQGNNRVVIDKDGAVKETNHYYPFGGLFDSGNEQPYKYNGKELDTAKDLNWYDYGARHYDATLGRWLVVDPLAEKYYSTSAYGYCLNNPIKFLDPNGMSASPIYDRDGNLLGTDDEGLRGDAIVMNIEDFKQGMSHEEALSKSTTISCVNAATKMALSYASLKFRPDYDGKLTLFEANDWYRNGNGQPLYVDASKINLSPLSIEDLKTNESVTYNFLSPVHTNLETGLVYGNISVTLLDEAGTVRLGNKDNRIDVYDFDNHVGGSTFRNFATRIGAFVAGKGVPYEIRGYGLGKLQHRNERPFGSRKWIY